MTIEELTEKEGIDDFVVSLASCFNESSIIHNDYLEDRM